LTKSLNFFERQQYHEQKRQIYIKEQQMMKENAALDGCTFAPSISGPTFSVQQYITSHKEERELRNYLEGVSYGGQS
jgi:hypothetical protein